MEKRYVTTNEANLSGINTTLRRIDSKIDKIETALNRIAFVMESACTEELNSREEKDES